MLRSMTGYGRKESETSAGTLVWEIRAVNHRYLELSFRLPEEFRAIEPAARELLSKQLKRGKIEASLKLSSGGAAPRGFEINEALVQQVVDALEQVSSKLVSSAGVDPMRVLSWPGVTSALSLDNEALHRDALESLAGALQDFVGSREREGQKTQQMISERVDQIEILVRKARDIRPAVVTRLQEKLRAKLDAMEFDLDSGRLEQELAMMAQKLDIDEELDRLDAHVSEIRTIFERQDPVGRRLDFLIQEFNREANTLGAKAADVDSTGISVELKVLIEQIREQVQNIE